MTAATSAPAAPVRPASRPVLARAVRSGLAVWVIVALAVLGLTVAEPSGFWSSAFLATVLTGTVVLGLAALGQHMVVLSGGIDLSVGSMASLSALLTAILIDGYPIRTLPAILAVLALGAAVGAVHGLVVARTGVAPFVVTLATFYLLQGAAFMVSTTPAGQVTTALSDLALERVGPFPYSFAVLVVAVVLVVFLLRRTAFGRHLYAVGGDSDAARANGVATHRVITLAYVAGSTLAAAAGVMLAARATIGSPTAGTGLELSAITVVVVGGTSLLGGRGSVAGTLGGVVLLALVDSSVVLLQLPATIVDLIRGLVILAAAALFVARTRR